MLTVPPRGRPQPRSPGRHPTPKPQLAGARGLLHTKRRNGPAQSISSCSANHPLNFHCSGSQLTREVWTAITPPILALASRSSRLSLRSTRRLGASALTNRSVERGSGSYVMADHDSVHQQGCHAEENNFAVEFGYITGWRIPSEVLKLQWRQVDLEARVVRLDSHTTKNDEGRTFPFTDALERLLETQKAEHDRLKAEGVICPWVFNRSNRKVKGKRIRPSSKRSGRRVRSGIGFRTTCGGPPCATWSAPAFPCAWPCR
jgi:integrase